jgi:hypothetical protein
MRFPRFPLPMSVARGVTNARNRVFDLGDAVVPGGVALFDLVFGLQRTKIAGVLVSSGLADALGRDSRDPVELAQELGLDPDVTTRVIEAAVASRLMRLDRQGRAGLTHVGAPLCRDHPNSIASWVAYYAHPDTAGAYAHLDAQLRDGAQTSGYQKAFGKSLWEYFDAQPEVGASFADAMRQSPSSVSPTWCGPIRGRGVVSSAMWQVGSGTCLRPSLNTGPTLAASFSIRPTS